MTRSWRMFAGQVERGGLVEFRNFGDLGYVEMYGHKPVEVELSEDEDGRYFGWIRAARGGQFPRTYTGTPIMIQPSRHLFAVQFPYGPEEGVRAGDGEIVRMSCREVGIEER